MYPHELAGANTSTANNVTGATRRAVLRFSAAILAFLVAIGLGAVALWDAERALIRTLGETRVAFARLGANQLRTGVASAEAGVRAVAAQTALEHMLEQRDRQGAQAMLREVQRNALFIDALVLLDRDGAAFAAHPENGTADLAREGATAALFDPRLSRFGMHPVILVRAPLSGGHGSVVGALSITRMLQRVDDVRFGDAGAVTVATREGRVLASSDPARSGHTFISPELLPLLRSERGAYLRYFSATLGREELAAVTAVHGLPLAFLVTQSGAEATGSLRWLRLALASAALALFVAGTAVVLRGVAERNRAVRTIAESRRRYRELVEMSSGLICEHDLDGILLMVNPAAAEALGYTRAELEGHSLRRFMAERHHAAFADYLARIAAQGEDRGFFPILAKDGRERIWQYHNRLYRERDRAPYVIGHAADLTERLQREDSLREQGWRDPLTGVRNRRYLAQFEREAPQDSVWGCIVVDLDQFKLINAPKGTSAATRYCRRSRASSASTRASATRSCAWVATSSWSCCRTWTTMRWRSS